MPLSTMIKTMKDQINDFDFLTIPTKDFDRINGRSSNNEIIDLDPGPLLGNTWIPLLHRVVLMLESMMDRL